MTPEEIKALQDENAQLKTDLATATTTIKERDNKIVDMERHVAEKNIQFKKLRDMTKEEKELYSEKELELKAQQDAILEQQEALQKEQQDFVAKQRESIIDGLVNTYAKGDKEIAAQIRIQLGEFKNVESLSTITEITPFIEKSVKALGIESKPDPLTVANNTGGRPADVKNEKDYADTEQGKQLMGALGFDQAPVEENKQ